MKKIISLLLQLTLLTGLLTITSGVQAQGPKDSYFIVTAYYSPLPDQEHYITGNYVSELILNGKGIAGASGKKVFSGMLAAPSKYAFGTKIHLDGLGIGSVEDRGGAIVPAGQRGYSYDRIDIWMGYGEEGLARAMFWGKRKVYGYVIDPQNKTTLNYNDVPAPKWALNGLTKKTLKVAQKKKVIDIFNASLGKGSDIELITELQIVLGKLGYIENRYTSGEYDTITIDAVYDFQISQNIIDSQTSPGAGSYGPKTRTVLEKLYNTYLEKVEKKQAFLDLYKGIEDDALLSAEKKLIELEKPQYGEISPRVRLLQKTLHTLGYFEYKDTAIFGVKTKNALLQYQLDTHVIEDINENGAGSFGPKTRAQFKEDIKKNIILDILKKDSLEEDYNTYIQPEVIILEIEEKVSLQSLSFKI